jgi:hypothetical protein
MFTDVVVSIGGAAAPRGAAAGTNESIKKATSVPKSLDQNGMSCKSGVISVLRFNWRGSFRDHAEIRFYFTSPIDRVGR